MTLNVVTLLSKDFCRVPSTHHKGDIRGKTICMSKYTVMRSAHPTHLLFVNLLPLTFYLSPIL
jgi:hypothetical protein